MKEILFRGKQINNSEWVSGFIVFAEGKTFIINNVKVEFRSGFNENILNFVAQEVVPETISQYTGLKDKNGKKIFEGDIIHKYGEYDGNFGSSNSVDYFAMNLLVGLENAKIIGNIYDNPELLEMDSERS